MCSCIRGTAEVILRVKLVEAVSRCEKLHF